MLSDITLKSIADNLARLSLDPLLQLKITAAIIAPLMAQGSLASGETSRRREVAHPPEKVRLGKSPSTLLRALIDASDDAEAVVRLYRGDAEAELTPE